MTMGSGKTYVAVAEAYRLLRYAGAERILFLVDRINLGRQAFTEFANYVTPDDRRKFTELYNVQVLRSNRIDPAAKVVITTIQRLYSILRGQSDEEFDPEAEEHSTFEIEPEKADEVLPVAYQPEVPIETFDVGFVDECHRSIYGRWGQVLDYFDMSLTGLTATAEHTTRVYFDQNVVTEYKHEQAVADGVNVPYTTYRIKTEVSEGGGEIAAGSWVEVRDLRHRRRQREQLEDEVTYDKAKLDRAVVNPDQIRTVVRTFKERVCTEIFPGPARGPEDGLLLQDRQPRRGRPADHPRGVQPRLRLRPQDHLQDRGRLRPAHPGLPHRPQVPDRGLGRSDRDRDRHPPARVPGLHAHGRLANALRADEGPRRPHHRPDRPPVGHRGSESKDRFVIVDCVGLTDEGKAWVDTRPLERKPGVAARPPAPGRGDGDQGARRSSPRIGARLARLAQEPRREAPSGVRRRCRRAGHGRGR